MPAKLSFKSVSVILIILLGALAYFNCLQGGFIWDDAGLVERNTYIRSLSGLPKIFAGNIWAGIGESSRAYRPLQIATYLVDYSIWRLNPFGYHLTNLLLHILAGITLYWLLKLIFQNELLALLSSLLFVCHPVQTEAVAYISGRADPLAAVFIFMAFGFYLKFLQTQKQTDYLLGLLSFILALLSRENALVLPVLLLAYHFAFKPKPAVKKCGAFFLIAGIYLALRLALMNTVLSDSPVETTLIQRLPGFFAALANYARIMFLPVDLHMEYGGDLFKFFNFRVLLGMGILIFLTACILKSRKANAAVFFALIWFLATLLPASNFYPLNAYMAEHWLYLPSIGIFIIFGKWFADGYARKKTRFAALLLAAGLLAAYLGLTINQNRYWRSELDFFKRTLKFAPGSARVYYHLGNIYCDLQDNQRGIAMYSQAIKMNPAYAEAYNNIGNVYINSGSNAEGITYCQQALKINPQLPEAYYNLGNAYYNLGENTKSIEMLKISVQLNPVYLEACNNLAAGLAQDGNLELAISYWNKCLEIDPGFTTAHFNLAKFHFMRKEYDLAIKHCDKVIALGGEVDSRFLEVLKPYRKVR